MQLSRTLGGSTNIIHGKEFPMNSVVLHFNNMCFVCTNFRQSRKKKPLQVYCYIRKEKKWVITFLKGKEAEAIWDYHKKCYKKRKKQNYSQMMKHDRKHKSSGGGSRIYNGSVTDYECAKNPLHDFRRVYN